MGNSYRNNRFRKEKRSIKVAPLISLLIVIAVGLHLYFANSTSPTTSFRLAVKELEEETILKEETAKLLEVAAQEPLIAQWAFYYSGLYYERIAEFEEALEYYSKVEPNTAPAILAQLGTLRVKGISEPSSESRRILGEIETKALELGWKEPLAEIRLLRAKDLISANDTFAALSLLSSVRTAKVNQKLTNEARLLSRDLIRSSTTTSPSVLLEQATLLNREGENEEALELISSFKQDLSQDSKAYFEASLVEESILRSLKRSNEADHLLLTISAHGPQGYADEALFKIAKNFWNINDHRRSLEFIDNLYSRFPSSSKIDDTRYMEARVLEEIQERKEAVETYKLLSGKNTRANLRYAAFKRLGWIDYLQGNYRDAKENFSKAAIISDQLLSQESPDGITLNDFLHATYWQAIAAEKLQLLEQAQTLHETIITTDPVGYYRMLSSAKLNRSILPPMQSNDPNCQSEIPQTLRERLELLLEGNLHSITQKEIEWHLFNENIDDKEKLLKKALLLSQYGSPESSIRTASQLFRNEYGSEKFSCHEKLFTQSFPLAFSEEVRATADKEGVDPALILAIIKTESHFIPTAKSTSDARGLMQLLLSTATSEGLTKEESLYTPEVNIRLGTKHINRLLKQHKELAHAIAAYNAGSGPVNRWIDRYGEIPIEEWIELIGYPETLNYVKSVLGAKAAYAARLQQSEPITQ